MRPSALHAAIAPRRDLLRAAAGAAAAGLLLAGCGGRRPGEAVEVDPGEDLMQEHGVLERVLLVYDEAARRLERGEPCDPAVVAAGAGLIRRFIEDYHERNEEAFVFPRLEAAGRLVEVVAVLRLQHARGREVTARIQALAGGGAPADLAAALRAFARMYRPHAAREDTAVFPAFRDLLGADAYRELGERFEDEEHRAVGEHGFADAVAAAARLEDALGIGDLARFTP